MFWIIILSITALAILFLLWLFKRDISATSDSESLRLKRNVELYQARLQRAQDDFNKGFIDESEWQQIQTEFARQLLADTQHLQSAPSQSEQRKKWLLLFVPMPLLAISLYFSIGAWPDWQITQQINQLGQSSSQQEYNQRYEQLHEAMAKRLQQKPEQLSYRFMLADYAMSKQDFAAAAMHYGIVAELMPDDDEVLARFAQAEYFRNDRQLNATVAQAMDKALSINPANRTVLGLQGIYSIEAGDFTTALTAWQRLLSTLPPDSPDADIIRQGIANIRERMGDEGQTDEAEQQALQSIAVNVELDSSLADLPSDLVVFVYARAAQGPAIPLAAERLQLGQLPISVTLDDSKAMLPQMKLSMHAKVIIGARISFSGQAIAQEGDYQVESEAVDWRMLEKLELRIKDKL